jgi:hypothetical protein
MTTMDRIEQLLANKQAHSIFFGTSVLKWRERFATIRTGAGETIATGFGSTGEEALADALSKIGPPVLDMASEPQFTTRPAIPGLTRRIPGL